METSMRLLHPIIPFITEELWARLPPWVKPDPACVPQSLGLAAYPCPKPERDDAAAERQMGAVQAAVAAMRSIKATYNVKGAKTEDGPRIEFMVKCPSPELRQALVGERRLIEHLARAELTRVVAETDNPKAAIAQVEKGLTVLLLSADQLIDAPAEIARLTKEADKAQKELETVRARLGKPDFVARAKPEVVEQNRLRVEEITQRLAELAQATAMLTDL